jgi:hypothetical protein
MSSGSIIFFLNQNDVVLVKKQKLTGCNWIFDRIMPGHTRFFLLLFFFQLGPVPAPGRLDPESTHQVMLGFKTMLLTA